MVFWMESEKKKINIKKLKTWASKYFSGKKRLIEYLLTILLLIASTGTYLLLIRHKIPTYKIHYETSHTEFNNAINNYRLENYDKAEVLFTRILDSSKKKKMKNLSAFYLGNIYYFKGNYITAISFYKKSLIYDRKDVYTVYNIALSYSKIGEIERAIKYALKAFKLDNDFLPNLLFLGNIYYAGRRYDDAIEVYNDSSKDIFRYNLAVSFLKNSNRTACINLLRDLISNPDANEVIKGLSFYNLGFLMNDDESEKAVDYFKNALSVFPSSHLLRYNFAVQLIREKNYDEAVSLLKSIEGNLGISNLDKVIGEVLFRSGNYDHAINLYLDVFRRTKDYEIAYIIGDIYLKLNNLEKAEYYYQMAVKDKGCKDAFINLALIKSKQGKVEKAIKICNDLIIKDKENLNIYLCMANIYFSLNNIFYAGENLELAKRSAKDDPYSLLKIAYIYKKNRFYSNALELYYKVLTLNPKLYRVYLNIAEIYYESGHFEMAKNVILKVKDRITDINMYYKCMLFLALLEDGQNAISVYKELIRDFPYKYEAYYNLSLKYIKDKKYDSAKENILSCIENVEIKDKTILSLCYSILAISNHYIGNLDEAYKDYNIAKKLDKNNEIPVFNLKMVGIE